MSIIFIFLLAFIIYYFLLWSLIQNKNLFSLTKWPKNKTLNIIWILWLIFLTTISPLSYHHGDMMLWQTSVINLLSGKNFPDFYTYMPIYSWFLAAIALPFYAFGLKSTLFFSFIIKLPVLVSYAYLPKLMVSFLPKKTDLAALGIVLAPVTIYYIFFGTNHIVMFFILLISLKLIRKKKWFWAGFFAFLSCYKFLLVPTIIVLIVLLFFKYKLKKFVSFLNGGLFLLLINFIYYLNDPDYLLKIINQQGATGINSVRIEPFHIFFFLKEILTNFETWYITNKVWFLIALLGIPLSLFFFKLKRLNFLQTLAFSYALVTIFSTEPYRLEPLIGLLWLDATYRKDLKAKGGIFAILFIHAITWFDWANSCYLVFDENAPLHLWKYRGLFLGLVIIIYFLLIFFEKNKKDVMKRKLLTIPS